MDYRTMLIMPSRTTTAEFGPGGVQLAMIPRPSALVVRNLKLCCLMTSTLSDQTNRIGDKVSLQVKATQVENDSLTYDAENLSVGLNIDPDTGLISGTVDPSAATGMPDAVTRQRQGHQPQHQ